MKKVFNVLAVVGLVLGTFSGSAMSREFADIYTECGIGAMIAPRNEAVAAVTNVTWDSGTTAISSNITSPDTCQGGQPKLASFIYESYDLIEKDLASGNGSYLDTVMVLAEVDLQAKQQFMEIIRQDFAKIVEQPSYSTQNRFQKSEALYNLVYKYAGMTS